MRFAIDRSAPPTPSDRSTSSTRRAGDGSAAFEATGDADISDAGTGEAYPGDLRGWSRSPSAAGERVAGWLVWENRARERLHRGVAPPVRLCVFNRPEVTLRLVGELKRAWVTERHVASDGPRPGNRHVEAGIVLEDDCFAAPEWFRFAREMLDRFADVPRVMQASARVQTARASLCYVLSVVIASSHRGAIVSIVRVRACSTAARARLSRRSGSSMSSPRMAASFSTSPGG